MKNKKEQNIAQLSKNISRKLIESMYFLEIMSDIIEGEGKLDTIIKHLRLNMKSAFSMIEQCRNKICIAEND